MFVLEEEPLRDGGRGKSEIPRRGASAKLAYLS